MACPSGHGITLQLLTLIGLCLLWENDGFFMRPMKSAERFRISCYGQNWNQHNLPFSSLTSTPSTVQQLSNEVLMNSNATSTNTAGSSFRLERREVVLQNYDYGYSPFGHFSRLCLMMACNHLNR